MGRCGCGSTCNCVITVVSDTLDISISGSGSVSDPYVISAEAITPPSVGTWLFAKNQGIAVQPALPGGTAAGQLAVLYIAHATVNTITANGWTLRSSSALTYTNATTFDVYTKVLVGGDAMPSIAFVSNYPNIYVAAVNITGLAYNSVATPIQTTGGTSNSSDTPAAAGGTVAVRGWFTNNGGIGSGTIIPPGGEPYSEHIPSSSDGNVRVTVENSLTAATGAWSGTFNNPAWIGHTVGVD